MPDANNKGADQPAHPRRLTSAFVVRWLDSIIRLVSISRISSLCLSAVAAQACLSLPWSKTPKTGFLVTKLIFKWGTSGKKNTFLFNLHMETILGFCAVVMPLKPSCFLDVTLAIQYAGRFFDYIFKIYMPCIATALWVKNTSLSEYEPRHD